MEFEQQESGSVHSSHEEIDGDAPMTPGAMTEDFITSPVREQSPRDCLLTPRDDEQRSCEERPYAAHADRNESPDPNQKQIADVHLNKPLSGPTVDVLNRPEYEAMNGGYPTNWNFAPISKSHVFKPHRSTESIPDAPQHERSASMVQCVSTSRGPTRARSEPSGIHSEFSTSQPHARGEADDDNKIKRLGDFDDSIPHPEQVEVSGIMHDAGPLQSVHNATHGVPDQAEGAPCEGLFNNNLGDDCSEVSGVSPLVEQEDLSVNHIMGLLIRHLKMSEQHTTQILREKKHVESLNDELRANVEILEENLHTTTQDLAQAAQAHEAGCEQLQQLSDKYRKLKNWAIEMNAEYAAMSRSHYAASRLLDDLRQEGKTLNEEVADVKAAQQSSQQCLQQMEASLQDTRNLADRMELGIRKKDAEIRSIKAEASRCASNEEWLHDSMKSLLEQQTAWEQRSGMERKETAEMLERVMTRIPASETFCTLSTVIQECLAGIQVLTTGQAAEVARTHSIDLGFTSITTELGRIKDGLSQDIGQLIKDGNDQSDCLQIETLKQNTLSLTNDMKTLIELQERFTNVENSILTEERMRGFLEPRLSTASFHLEKVDQVYMTLIKLQDQLQHDDTARQIHIASTFEQKIRDLEQKLGSNEAELFESRTKLTLAERSLSEVSTRQKQAQADTLDRITEARREAQDRATVQFKTATKEMYDQIVCREKEVEKKHRLELETCAEQVQSRESAMDLERKLKYQAQAEANLLSGQLIQLREQQSLDQENIKLLKEQLESCTAELDDSICSVERARSKAETMTILEDNLSAKDHEIKKLTSELDNVRDLQRSLSVSEIERTRLDSRVSELQAVHDTNKTLLADRDIEVEHARQQLVKNSSRIMQMSGEAEALREELVTFHAERSRAEELENDLAAAQALLHTYEIAQTSISSQRAELEHNREMLETKSAELAQAQENLKEARSAVQQLQILQGQNLELEAQVARQNNDDKGKADSLEALAKSRADLRGKDQVISEIKIRLSEQDATRLEIQTVRNEVRRNEIELQSAKSRVVELEAQLKELDSVRDQIPDHVLDAFNASLSQEMGFSLDTDLPSSSEHRLINIEQNVPISKSQKMTKLTQPARRAADRRGGATPRTALLGESEDQPSCYFDSIHESSERIVVPDSQKPNIDLRGKENTAPSRKQLLESKDDGPSSSELTDLDGTLPLLDVEADDIFDIPESPSTVNKGQENEAGYRSKRGKSIGSQESMLLQSTPGQQSRCRELARTQTEQSGHGDLSILEGNNIANSSSESAPMRLRSGSQVQLPSQSIGALPIAMRPQPNSAVKRRRENLAESDDNPKRLKEMTSTAIASKQSTSKSTVDRQPARRISTHGLPSTLRSSDGSRTHKKSKHTGQKSAKHERYSTQFAPDPMTT